LELAVEQTVKLPVLVPQVAMVRAPLVVQLLVVQLLVVQLLVLQRRCLQLPDLLGQRGSNQQRNPTTRG